MKKLSNKTMLNLYKPEKPIIMGVVNVTPDSFSDGGEYYSTNSAKEQALCLFKEGAQIIDIGGESTRPGSDIVSIKEEIRRIVPVISSIKSHEIPYISIDTRNAETMSAAINAGANFINDVSGLLHDEKSADLIAGKADIPVCIMHMQGVPQTMQARPHYNDVTDDVMAFFEERLEFCQAHGISQNRVILDPGIGFGKTLEHNLSLLKNLKKFQQFGCAVLLGVSRKSFIGAISGEKNPKNRISGSLAAAIYGLEAGVQIFRVHDVKETLQAFDVYRAINNTC